MIGIYPGSFDPVTNGHLDIMDRAAGLADKLIVAVLNNSAKAPLFSLEERLEMLRCCTRDRANIEVMSFEGLLMEFARQQGASFVVRGLRALSDFEAELAMASINKRLAPEIETVFLMTSPQWSYLSSSMVKELAHYNGEFEAFVPACVANRFKAKQY
jgi:pantetheine-phosphate adenylyltransferase